MSNPYGNTVKRALPLSKNSREALGYDLMIWLNIPLDPAEVRQVLSDRTRAERKIEELKRSKPGPMEFPQVEITQLRHNIMQMNQVLGQFFSGVWLTADGQPLPVETVMGLHTIVGQPEALKMMTDTLAAMESYQSMGKGGTMGGPTGSLLDSSFSQAEPAPEQPRPGYGGDISQLSPDTAKAVLAYNKAQELARSRRGK